ncbi:hypothetical protein NDU88_001102, partial [Pleurodeles waltl]
AVGGADATHCSLRDDGARPLARRSIRAWDDDFSISFLKPNLWPREIYLKAREAAAA